VDVDGGAGFVARVFGRQSRQYPLILCGSPFCTGPHGYIFQKEIQVEEATTALCYALTDVIHFLRKDKRDTQAVIVKDFYPKDYNALNELKECGFHTFAVDHLLKMPLDGYCERLLSEGLQCVERVEGMRISHLRCRSFVEDAIGWELEDLRRLPKCVEHEVQNQSESRIEEI
jgi:hypothetical protein